MDIKIELNCQIVTKIKNKSVPKSGQQDQLGDHLDRLKQYPE